MNSNLDVYNGFLHIEGDKIKQIGEGLPDTIDKDTTLVDLNGKWVLPGLINTHGHTGMSLLRGYSDDLPLESWLKEKMWPMEAKLDKESVKAASSLAILEMMKTGTTTFLDMYHIFLDEIANLVDESGLRAVITRGMIGLCSEVEQLAKLDEAVSFATNWRGQADGRIQTMLSPHAPYTCPPSFIEMIVEKAKENELPIHIHLSETKKEVEDHIAQYGIRPVEHLLSLGVFSMPTLIAHGVHVNDEEIDILASNNVAVSHNPMSNLKLGSGIAPIPKMIKQGVLVALGTDSVASNNNLDVFQELRMAALIHKGNTYNSTVITATEALQFATVNGAKALQNNNIGSLTEGNEADFITIDPSKHPHLQPKEHIISHIVYSASGADVCDVYVKGKQLMKDRNCLTVDEERIIFEANKQYNRIQA